MSVPISTLSDKMSIHPEILSLQRLKDQARDQVRNNQWEALLDSLWCWNVELKEIDQDTELIDKIHKEQITLDGYAYPGGKNTRMRDMKKIYKEWYSTTMTHTWDKGYFENKKYAPETKRDTTFDRVKKWTEDRT